MEQRFTLRNGVELPPIGFGTYGITGTEGPDQIAEAIRCGYRLLDTASFYQNETEVGGGIRRSGVNRRELLVTTKAWRDELGYDGVMSAFDRSLRRLGLNYVDLYLLHWPSVPARDANWRRVNAESWRALEELYAMGRVRAIGVSNYLPEHLRELAKTAVIFPMVNQIEYHPGWLQPEAARYCRSHGIQLEAWSPMGRGRVLEAEPLVRLAAKYGLNPGQLCLCFAVQNGVIPLPKSTHSERMRENLEALNTVISPEDMAAIAALPELGWSGEDPAVQA